MPRRTTVEDPKQIMLFANIVADGMGGFRLVPQKPVQEIDSRDAERMLTLSRGSMSRIVNTQLGQKYLRWRWLTDRKGKRLFERESVIEYREATKSLE